MTDVESKIIELAKTNTPCKTIARTLEISKYTVSSTLIENGFTYHVTPISKDKLDYIIHRYVDDYISIRDIVKETGFSYFKIKNLLMINGYDIRPTAYHSKSKFHLNEKYFDIIDNEHKAYWLGFLYADGYNNEKTYQIEISLKEEDGYILEEFKKDIEAIYKISDKKIKLNDKIFYAKRLILYSKHLSETLKEKGCFQKKSLFLKFPGQNIVPESLLRHFIRGYFDGDGCVSGFKFSLTGTKDFLKSCAKIIRDNTGISKAEGWYPTGKAWDWQHSSKRDLAKIYNYLYDNATIFLKRKKNKFLIN